MAGQRQPIELLMTKGKTHMTKQKIKERKQQEIPIIDDDITPPFYLTKKQKQEFDKVAAQLKKLKILGNTDVDALGRWVIAQEIYIKMSKKLNSPAVMKDIEQLKLYSSLQDRYFKQCRSAANDLGLTISSRCRLVVPQSEQPKENKFKKKFG